MMPFILALLASFLGLVASDEHSQKYEVNERVVVWMNVVGPYHNSQETYKYFSLPFCRGPVNDIGHYHESIAEAIQGVELENSGLDVHFKVNTPVTEYCRMDMNEERLKMLSYVVERRYTFEMYIDSLPVMGWLGDMADSEGREVEHSGPGVTQYIYTHKRLDFYYNGNQIIEANLVHDKKVPLRENQEIPFTYEVTWTPTTVLFEDRFDKFLDPAFFKHKIHWFSVFNSFMMVVFLVGLVCMILMRTLRCDYQRYSREEGVDDLDRELGDEYGWKQVHGEVFRPPSHLLLFATCIGTGAELAVTALLTVTCAMAFDLYEGRGELLTAAIFIYALTAVVGGYVGGGLYVRLGGKAWIQQMLVQASLFPAIVCGTSLVINFVAMSYSSTRAIPFTTMLSVAAIGFFIVTPLTLLGAIAGRSLSGQPDFPCRVSSVPRLIPAKKWYSSPIVISLLGGILPFGSIFIEMYFVFTSFWAYKIYYVYGFMALVFVILAVVAVCVDIVCVYFLLNSEDYRWWWSSFAAAASTALYVFLYAIYYFFYKTKMYGFFQTTFYFGYTIILCVALGMATGAIGHMGSSVFVRKIYQNVKVD